MLQVAYTPSQPCLQNPKIPIALFVEGDTLFALGCGRLFEGNAQQMWTSLSKMTPLPPATKVFCAHEYTQSNAKFALSIDPENQALQKRAALINDLRKQVYTLLLTVSSENYSQTINLLLFDISAPAAVTLPYANLMAHL